MIRPIHRAAIAATLFAFVIVPREVRAGEVGAAAPTEAAAERVKSDVRGRVVMESDGKPVANAEVRLVTWTENGRRYDTRKTTTNERGEFVFEAVAPGKHRLVAFFEDFASRQSRYKGQPVDLSTNEPVTLTLQKMPSIAVHVVSKADGKPIPDALVRLVWTDTDRNHRTDDQGKVLLHTLTHEVWHVEVQAKGFAEQEQAVNLDETDAAEIEFALEPGGVLFGIVNDESGMPIPEAGLSVFPANHRGGQIEYLTTDANGCYRFDFLPVKHSLELSTSKDGYLDRREQIVLAGDSAADRELNITLKRQPDGGTIRGTVSDADPQRAKDNER